MTTVNAGERLLPCADLSQAIASALKRQQTALGGKNLAGCFDGRGGHEVAESTVSRWISEPRRFPAVFVGVLAEMDLPFRDYLLHTLVVSGIVPGQVVASLSAPAADEYRRFIEERLLDAVYGGPARHGEHY